MYVTPECYIIAHDVVNGFLPKSLVKEWDNEMRSCASVSLKGGFYQPRSPNQKRRTWRSSVNSVLIPFTTPSLTIKWKLSRRSLKQKWKNKANHKAWERALWLVYRSSSTSDSDSLVFTWSWATESEAELEENGNFLILPTPIPSLLRLHFYDFDSNSVKYIHTYIHNSTWIGLLLTTRDFPTFSVVVVIKVKKLFWLLSRGKKTSLKVVAILLPTVLSRTTITQIIVNCEVMGEMLLEPITFPTWNV